MKKEPTTLDVVPFLWWILSGLVFGFLAGFLINYFIPVEYSSRAVLASNEAPGITTHLSIARAKWISEEIGGRESPEEIRDRTILRTTINISCGWAVSNASNSAIPNRANVVSRMARTDAERGARSSTADSPTTSPRPTSPSTTSPSTPARVVRRRPEMTK